MALVFTEDAIHRELWPLNEYQKFREIIYLVEFQFWYTPEEGDDWNSPYIPSTLELEAWFIAEITRHTSKFDLLVFRPGFVGPPEPGIVWFYDVLELTDEEYNGVLITIKED